MRRILSTAFFALAAAPAAGEGPEAFVTEGKAGLELRYRFENVEQDDKPESADASTLRLRLNLASGTVGGFSGVAELDHVAALGSEHYDDTRNGQLAYPVVPDPEGTDLNQAWLQYRGAGETLVRFGRQRLTLDDERFVSFVGWRQNEQTFDALRLETKALPAATLNYVYVENVRRAFGPDAGVPPAELDSDSHLLNARFDSLPAGVLTIFGYLLDFDNAPQLSSDTFGALYIGDRGVGRDLKLGWSLAYAAQQDAGHNVADVDGHYSLAELRLDGERAGVMVGRELLSGERGDFGAEANPAFQTPLATPHKWQGWADKFVTTPSAGIVDLYLGLRLTAAGWTGRVVWHHFDAEATNAAYGTEWDVSVSRKFAERYELLLKLADYSADELFADTRKLWLQLSAGF
jgi:hypothetical protein